MSSLDVMGVVGTWVAVGLAVFALVGVVGPLLVWRASNSARNQALAKLDEGLSRSHAFVTPGVRLGRATYLFRRVRAPLLTEPPILPPKWIPEYTDTALPPQESAGWVQLGAVLQNYKLKYRTGDALILKDETMRLPISVVWLFLFGLIGRFGSRSDTGEWILEPPTDNVVFKQALPGKRLGKRVRGRDDRASRKWETIDAPPDVDHNWMMPMAPIRRVNGRLRGLTGRMRCYNREGVGAVEFKAHKKGHIKAPLKEVLDVAGLFWLSMGCPPMVDGKLSGIFYLDDVQYPTQRSHSGSPTGSESGWPSPDLSLGGDPFHATRGGIVPHGPRFRAVKHDRRPHFQEPRFWSFTKINEALTDFTGIAAALGAEENISKRSLTDLADPMTNPDEIAALREDAKRTFIPCHRKWVRLGPPVPEGSSFSAFFLRRADAQLLARVMLQLPICSHGYLINIPPGSACRDMLVEACSLLPRILYFLVHYFDQLKARTKPSQLENDILPKFEKILLMTIDYSYTRLFASLVYDLDLALVTTVSLQPNVHLFVQVLVITSPEFRDLISQSLRDLEACLDSSLSFDPANANIYTYTIMGASKVFPLDLHVLLEDPRAFAKSGITKISYVDVLLLVLKACLRSTFLETSLDSTPLFDAVFKPGGDVFEAS